MTEPQLPDHSPRSHPVGECVRARLRDAQKREAEALRAVTAAEKVRAKARLELDRAEQSLAIAQAGLVTVSGAERAALLLDQPVAVLRSRIRAATTARREAGHE